MAEIEELEREIDAKRSRITEMRMEIAELEAKRSELEMMRIELLVKELRERFSVEAAVA